MIIRYLVDTDWVIDYLLGVAPIVQKLDELKPKAKIMGGFDILIAATCLANDLTLLTNNFKHFERIEGLPIISLPR
jgi:tRNA(fMet)-specific endonuclease VapC